MEPGVFSHYRSPTQVYDTISGKIKPTILSPAEETWLLKLNKGWREKTGGGDITTGKAQDLLRTPVIIAMWQSRAQVLGCWPVAGPECTWQRIHELAASPSGWGMRGHPEWGKFKFGYAYVGESDVGTWTAVLLCMAGAGKTSALTMDDVTQAGGCGQTMADVEKAKVHSGVSSPWLLGQLQTGGPEYLDAVTTYEKEVISFNLRNKQNLREPLVAAYPRDGTAVARHPFAILDGAPWVTPEQVEGARVFQQFLLSPEQQKALLDVGQGLRPADPTAPLGAPIDASNGANPDAELVAVSLSDILVLDQIIAIWTQVRKPAAIALVFDKSGSMSGDRMNWAIKGAQEFVGAMAPDDYLIWMPFDNRVYPGVKGKKKEIGEKLRIDIGTTVAGGETALYDAVGTAYETLEAMRKSDGDAARYGIVLLSDGENTSSRMTLPELEALVKRTEGDSFGIQIHAIGVGEANDQVLTKIANSSHGRYWKAKIPSVLSAVYKGIVPYF